MMVLGMLLLRLEILRWYSRGGGYLFDVLYHQALSVVTDAAQMSESRLSRDSISSCTSSQ